MIENLCYTRSVPTIRDEKKEVMIGTKVGESVKREIDRIAESDDRTPAYVIRELLMRGLALYQLDGKLRDDAPTAQTTGKILATISPGQPESKEEIRRRMIEQAGGIPMRPTSRQKLPLLTGRADKHKKAK